MPTPNTREVLLHVAKSMSAAPKILVQLGRMRLDPAADLRDITALLKRDASLTSRILRIANSPFYTTGEPFASLEQALARVGFGEIYRIAGFAAVAQVGSQGLRLYGISGAQLRENSLLSALVMEELAKMTGIDSEEAYSAGLLRSTGKVALDGLTRDSSGTYNGALSGPLVEWEIERSKISNCEAAAFILTEWHFPTPMIAAIGHHYFPEKAPSDGAGVCPCVSLGPERPRRAGCSPSARDVERGKGGRRNPSWSTFFRCLRPRVPGE